MESECVPKRRRCGNQLIHGHGATSSKGRDRCRRKEHHSNYKPLTHPLVAAPHILERDQYCRGATPPKRTSYKHSFEPPFEMHWQRQHIGLHLGISTCFRALHRSHCARPRKQSWQQPTTQSASLPGYVLNASNTMRLTSNTENQHIDLPARPVNTHVGSYRALEVHPHRKLACHTIQIK